MHKETGFNRSLEGEQVWPPKKWTVNPEYKLAMIGIDFATGECINVGLQSVIPNPPIFPDKKQ